MQSPTVDTQDPSKCVFRIEFSHTEVKPPVYIAGTFGDTPWLPIEMDVAEQESTAEYKFSTKLSILKGEDHQYKFRIGEGEWWVLNENEPTVTDDAGNRNNLLQTGISEGTWNEMVQDDREDGVWEERYLTKYTAEERQKNTGILHQTIGLPHELESIQATPAVNPLTSDVPVTECQEQENANVESADNDSARPIRSSDSKSENKRTFLVPEEPREPTTTPALPNEKITDFPETSLKKSLGSIRSDVQNAIEDSDHSRERKTDAHNRSRDSDTEPEGEANQPSLLPKALNTPKEVPNWNPDIDQVHKNLEYTLGLERSTPIDERVPLLSHECIITPDGNDKKSTQVREETVTCSRLPKYGHATDRMDFSHPSIEIFPTDRASILAKIREIQSRLPEDETRVDEILAPSQTHVSSPINCIPEHPPALVPITEEVESIGSEEFTENKANSDIVPGNIDSEEENIDTNDHAHGPQGPKIEGNNSDSVERDSDAEHINEVPSTPSIHSGNNGAIQGLTGKARETLELPQDNPEDVQTTTDEDLENKSLGSPVILASSDSKDVKDSAKDAPNTAVDSSLPKIAIKNVTLSPESNINAKTTGFSGENSHLPNTRKSLSRRDLKSPERPITPGSMRSNKKDVPNGNFLKVFWRVIVVEWIGGMIMRFCGRGRRRTLMTLGVLTTMVIAPALYMFISKENHLLI